ncbi:MAG: hypothetical protein H7Y17_04900 [Chlorobia bacterium]|nr:hypothetical protein [Fimbriimonadaceae bacterium]
MTFENTDSELKFRVIVSAIVGGPFDLRKDDTLPESEAKEWKESFIRLGAIEPIYLN